MKRILYVIGHFVLFCTIFIIIYFLCWSLSSLDINLAVDIMVQNKYKIIAIRKICAFLFAIFSTFVIDYWSVSTVFSKISRIFRKYKGIFFIVFVILALFFGIILYLYVNNTWLV